MKTKFGKLVLVIAVVVLTGVQAKSSGLLSSVEVEPELEIESWMVDAAFWNDGLIDLTPATEKSLSIEKWMYDDVYWK
jgi:hypothetical protein